MGLLDLFRPKWKHSRADVRLEAVRQLGEDEVPTLTEVARHDPEAKIREIAYKRLGDPSLLVELAREERDEALRELAGKRASELSLRTAIDEADARVAIAAVDRVTHAKMLVDVVRKAKSGAARERALSRLDDPRALAELAQKADEPQIRELALSKIDDPKALRDVVLGEQSTKTIQGLALARLTDLASLRAVVERGRNKAIRNQAKERIVALGLFDPAATAKAEKPKKQLDPAAEARLKQRKIEAELRKSAEESRKRSVGEKKAQLEAEHLERLKRLEAEADAPAHAAVRPEPEPEVARPRAPERELSPEEQAKRAARDAERAEREAQKAQKAQERAQQAKENVVTVEYLVAKLESLLESGDPKEAGSALKEAHTSPAARGPLPEGSDALRKRFEEARTKLSAKLQEMREAEDWRRWANVPKLEALITKAEQLAKLVSGAVKLEEGQELDARKVSRELKAMQSEWKEIGGAPKVKADSLWERFKTYCDLIYEENKKGLEAADEERSENLKMKEELCGKVEALLESPEAQSNAKAVGEQIKQLQEDWKKIGPVPRSENDRIWERFRAACDKFFASRKASYEKQDEVRGETLKKQLELVAKAESLQLSQDFKGTADKLKALQDEWKALGPGKKGESDEAWKKFRAACDAFFERRKAHFGEMDEERSANLAKKEALVAEAEKLAASEEAVDADAKIRELMAEWKKIGPVAKDKGDEIWARFGKALDTLRNPTPPTPEILAEAKGAGFANKALGGLAEKLKGVSEAKSADAKPIEAKPIEAKPTPTLSPTPTPEPTPAPAPTPAPTPTPIIPSPVKEPTPPPAPLEAPPAPAPPPPAPLPVEVPDTVPPPAQAPTVAAPVVPVVAAPPEPEPPKEPEAKQPDAWPAPEAWTLPDDTSKS